MQAQRPPLSQSKAFLGWKDLTASELVSPWSLESLAGKAGKGGTGTHGTDVTTATTASIASRESSSRQAGITNSFLPFFHHFYEISTHVFVLIQRARDRSCRIDQQGL